MNSQRRERKSTRAVRGKVSQQSERVREYEGKRANERQRKDVAIKRERLREKASRRSLRIECGESERVKKGRDSKGRVRRRVREE